MPIIVIKASGAVAAGQVVKAQETALDLSTAIQGSAAVNKLITTWPSGGIGTIRIRVGTGAGSFQLTMIAADTPGLTRPIKLQIAGLNQGYDSVVTRGPGPAGDYSVWYYKAGTLLAVDAMNAAAAYMVGKRLIESGLSVAPDRVRDLASDVKSWLKP